MRILSLVCGLVLAAVVTSCTTDSIPTATNDTGFSGVAVQTDDISMMKSDGTDKGAIRWIPDEECGVFDGSGDFFPTSCRNEISTYSANGNAMAVVRASGVPNPTGKVVHWNAYNPPPILLVWYGFESPPVPCALLDTDGELTLFTLHWSGVVSSSGEALFRCQYSKNWEFQWPSQG